MARLDDLLAINLGASRTAAARVIEAGAVYGEDGAPLRERRANLPGSGPWRLTVNGAPLTLHESFHVLQHKPVGVVTALRDPRHPTAAALLGGVPLRAALRPVGRLDLDTSGLLLWTTSGQWVHLLTHPKRGVPRTYEAALARPWRPLALPPSQITLGDGHRPRIVALEPMAPALAHPALHVPRDAAALARIIIVGGVYHEVRRIFAALGNRVLALARVAFGHLELPRDLPPGQHRPVDPRQVL